MFYRIRGPSSSNSQRFDLPKVLLFELGASSNLSDGRLLVTLPDSLNVNVDTEVRVDLKPDPFQLLERVVGPAKKIEQLLLGKHITPLSFEMILELFSEKLIFWLISRVLKRNTLNPTNPTRQINKLREF